MNRGYQMKLVLNKGQKTSLTGKVVFGITARVELTPDERAALDKYKFNKEVLYAKENVSPTFANRNTWGGIARNITAAALNLRVSVDDLVKGKTVECKSITEILDVEHTFRESCEALKALLVAASTFDGETVHEY